VPYRHLLFSRVNSSIHLITLNIVIHAKASHIICFSFNSSSALVNWYRNIINGKYALKGDYYSLMVFCDFINFLISVSNNKIINYSYYI